MKPDLRNLPSKLIEAWRKNPSLAAQDLLYNPLSPDPDDRCTIIPIQRVILNRLWVARNGIVLACRGTGKTYQAAVLAILTAWLFPGRRVGCLSASFRQAKQIFDEISSIWQRSPLLQACTERAPILSNDACRLIFKPVPGHNPSVIMALPLADGSKIRGARFHTIICDEAVHIPADVFNMVIRPMGATHQEPIKAMRMAMEKEKILASTMSDAERKKRLDELEGRVRANQIIMYTSGYYSFNYVYDLYCKYSNRMHGKFDDKDSQQGYTRNPLDYATFQIPWWAIPKDFLSEQGLADAKNDMSALQFRMEYEAAWISDSGGFFKASDVEGCRSEACGIDVRMMSSGEPGKMYLMGIDPARTSDAFAIVVGEFDPDFGVKLVRLEQYFRESTDQMVRRIFELTNLFNIVYIGIDKGGGGHQVADYLALGLGDNSPIYDMEDEKYKGLRGSHILKVVDFSSNWIEAANHNTYELLQKRQVVFPRIPTEGASSDQQLLQLDTEAKIINQLIMQLLSVQHTETKSGRLHFDLPQTGGGFVRHKDLYSAFLILCDLAYKMMKDTKIPHKRVPLLGLIRNKMDNWF